MNNDKISLNQSNPFTNSMIELISEKEVLLYNTGKDTQILLLQGKPINEPVYQYGPFVMNTKSEINEAFNDYQRTSFGGWNWKENGPIHGKFQGRFAKLINGQLTQPS